MNPGLGAAAIALLEVAQSFNSFEMATLKAPPWCRLAQKGLSFTPPVQLALEALFQGSQKAIEVWPSEGAATGLAPDGPAMVGKPLHD